MARPTEPKVSSRLRPSPRMARNGGVMSDPSQFFGWELVPIDFPRVGIRAIPKYPSTSIASFDRNQILRKNVLRRPASAFGDKPIRNIKLQAKKKEDFLRPRPLLICARNKPLSLEPATRFVAMKNTLSTQNNRATS